MACPIGGEAPALMATAASWASLGARPGRCASREAESRVPRTVSAFARAAASAPAATAPTPCSIRPPHKTARRAVPSPRSRSASSRISRSSRERSPFGPRASARARTIDTAFPAGSIRAASSSRQTRPFGPAVTAMACSVGATERASAARLSGPAAIQFMRQVGRRPSQVGAQSAMHRGRHRHGVRRVAVDADGIRDHPNVFAADRGCQAFGHRPEHFGGNRVGNDRG